MKTAKRHIVPRLEQAPFMFASSPACGSGLGRGKMLRLIKPGDWLVLLLGMIATVWLFATLWQGHAADKAVVRSGGKIVAEFSLSENRSYLAHGPLGTSRIEIHNRRARVAEDPSPRQYCVKQGWLSQAGEAALCLPNQISLELTGAKKLYDSLSY